MKLATLLIPVLLLSLGGCAKNIQSKDAVKKAILDHLAKRSDLALGNMDIDVTNVTFKPRAPACRSPTRWCKTTASGR